jgi:hypothetical protein
MSKSSLPEVRHPSSRVRVYTRVRGKSRTHQSHKESVDINNIVRRFDHTGELPPANRPPQYADVTHLQGDLTDRINFSRETLDVAGRSAEDLDAKRKAESEKKHVDLVAEVERLRKIADKVKENRDE